MTDRTSIKITDNFRREELADFVHDNPKTSIFQTMDMEEVYKRNRRCNPLTLVAIDEDTDEILASLLAKILKVKQGFFSSFSTHSTIRGGPVFANNKDGIVAVSLLLQRYNEIIKKNALYSRIYPLNDPLQIILCFKENGYEYGDWQNFLIDLTKSKEELWRNLRKSKRRGINKAKRYGVQVVEAADKDDVSIFYNLTKERQAKRENPFEDISPFEAVFDVLVPKKEANFFFAKYKNEYIATRLVLLYKGTIYAWYTGSASKYLQYQPNDLLAWHIIEWGSENGFHTFDFGGAGELHEFNEGWVEFKKGFGGKLVNYGRYTKIHQPKKLWFSMKIFEVYKKIILKRT